MASASAVSRLICVVKGRCGTWTDVEEGTATGLKVAMLVGVVCCSGTGCWMLWSRFDAEETAVALVTAVDATMGGGSCMGAGATPTGCVGITMGGAGGLAAVVGRAVGVEARSGEGALVMAAVLAA